MKRVLILMGLCWSLTGFAQDANRAAAAAENQRREERYQQMTTDIQELQAANSSLQRKISNLEEELAKVRAAASRPVDNSGVQEDQRKLAERIQEVDKKRENDKQVILDEVTKRLAKLERAVVGTATTHGSTPPTQVTPTDDTPVGETFPYVIKPNNTLGEIVKAFNEKFKEKGWKTITQKQVRDINPKVNFDRLLIGQKILIPKPAGAN